MADSASLKKKLCEGTSRLASGADSLYRILQQDFLGLTAAKNAIQRFVFSSSVISAVFHTVPAHWLSCRGMVDKLMPTPVCDQPGHQYA